MKIKQEQKNRREKKLYSHGIVAGVELDGLGGEAEGTGTALSRKVEGAEVVHDLAEVVAVGDGDHGAGPIVLRHWYHVGHLRPTAGAGLSVLHRHPHLGSGGSNSRAGGEDEPARARKDGLETHNETSESIRQSEQVRAPYQQKRSIPIRQFSGWISTSRQPDTGR